MTVTNAIDFEYCRDGSNIHASSCHTSAGTGNKTNDELSGFQLLTPLIEKGCIQGGHYQDQYESGLIGRPAFVVRDGGIVAASREWGCDASAAVGHVTGCD